MSIDYHTYRVIALVTVTVEVPPGTEDAYQYATDKAEDFLYANAPNVDWAIDEIDDVTNWERSDDE
jgi:hypothetical protein